MKTEPPTHHLDDNGRHVVHSGADLAKACADAVEGDSTGIAVGGPRTMTWREIAALAFEVLDRPARINSIPEWLIWPAIHVMRLVDRHKGEILAFFATMATTDMVAPSTGTLTLEKHFRELATPKNRRSSEQRQTREGPAA